MYKFVNVHSNTLKASDSSILELSKLSSFKNLTIEDTTVLNENSSEISSILDNKARVNILNTKLITTPKMVGVDGQCLTGYKLIVEGEITLRVHYLSNTTDSISIYYFNISFSTYIILPENFKLGTQVKVKGYIEDIYTSPLNEKTIFSSIILLLLADL